MLSAEHLTASRQRVIDDPTRVTLPQLVRLKATVRAVKRPSGGRVQASLSGGNASRALGRGLDFSEVREYQTGDDVRTIDWKVTARSGKPHTKVYQEERERPFLIAIDLRSPMYFATRVAYKSVIAARLAAMLAWAASAQRDRVGGLVFSDEGIKEVKPAAGSRGVTRLLNEIVKTQNKALNSKTSGHVLNKTQWRFDEIYKHLRRSAHTGSSIVLLSDFAYRTANDDKAASQMVSHNHVVVCRIFDVLEKQLPPPATYAITDGAQRGTINTASAKVREAYQLSFEQQCRATKKLFSTPGSHYLECATSDSPVAVASQILKRLPGSL
jgi:uncharacterized protein (DUF58 family)